MSRKKDKPKVEGEGIRVFMGGMGYSRDGKKHVVPLHEVKWYPGGRKRSAKEMADLRAFLAGHDVAEDNGSDKQPVPIKSDKKRRKAS